MSDFVQQHAVKCSFNSSDSWIILTPIEQSIKNKIEAIGTPLKEWDIKIYRGVLTGYNEAFIITTEKREEILSNCKTDDEREKTADLIRPILRGRDIKRYGYTWADLWLIATFPSRHYNIDDFPAVKSYLLSIGKERLEQTGKTHFIEGEKVKARKKTNNKWFETQDSISYWEDFSKPKIVWGNLNLRASYVMVEENCFVNAPSPIIVPGSKYLLGILNSQLADYYIRRLGVTRNGGYFEYKPMFVEKIPVPHDVDQDIKQTMEKLIDKKDEDEIDKLVFSIYGLSSEEQEYITSLLS